MKFILINLKLKMLNKTQFYIYFRNIYGFSKDASDDTKNYVENKILPKIL